jgi:hypothetical protein
LAVAFFAEVLGYLARPFNTLLGFIFLAIFVGQSAPRPGLSSLRRRWKGWLLVVLSIIGMLFWFGWVRLLLLSLLIGGIRLARQEEQGDDKLGTFQYTAFAYGLFLWFWRETATGWVALDGLAGGINWISHQVGLKLTLGATASGIPLTALFFIYGTVIILTQTQNRAKKMLGLSASLLAGQLLFVASQAAVGGALFITLSQRPGAGPAAAWQPFAFLRYLYPNDLQGLNFLLCLLAVMIAVPATLIVADKKPMVAPGKWAIILGALAIFAGAGLNGFLPPRPDAGGEILLHDAGYLNWQMPNFQAYGDKSGGMFGRLPQFLEAEGYQVKRLPPLKKACDRRRCW